MRLKVHWKSNLPPSWTSWFLASFCHILNGYVILLEVVSCPLPSCFHNTVGWFGSFLASRGGTHSTAVHGTAFSWLMAGVKDPRRPPSPLAARGPPFSPIKPLSTGDVSSSRASPQQDSLDFLTRAKAETARWLKAHHVLPVKASHKVSSDSRGGETNSISWWAGREETSQPS